MISVRKIAGLTAVATFLCAGEQAHAEVKSFDVVVYGGTAGGVSAAVQAARLGKSVALIESAKQLGGMTSGGLGATDIGFKTSVSGFAREFYHRVWTYYQDPAAWKYETREEYLPRHHDAVSENLEVQWFFEPKVAEKIFNQLVRESGVSLFTGQRLKFTDGIAKTGNKITSLTTENGDVFRGKIFVDATYEGDLMAKSGVSYLVGRESNAQYGETLNGILPNKPLFSQDISPYKIPGDPASGTLKGVDPKAPGEAGQGDSRVQAYTFRVCLTDAEENKAPLTKPENYDPELYELHLRFALANPDARPGSDFFKLTPMPNRKTDSNNKGSFSTDFVGKSQEWAEADYAKRERLWQEHADYVRGLLWFLGNDPRLPAPVREEAKRWGLPKDEFLNTNHWPFQLYVREARRMVSDYVVTENDCRRFRIAEDGIVLASYPMDSHFTSRYADAQGRLRVEGGLLTKISPFPVSYRAIAPKEKECANLLVPVCLSASHAAYGSIRMEPVFMMLGQASGFAAAQAIDAQGSVQAVPAARLRELLGTQATIAEIKLEPVSRVKSPAASAEDDLGIGAFQQAVDRLHELGILEDEEYWLANAKPGRGFDGERVAKVLINTAGKWEPAATLEEALSVLGTRKIVRDEKGYWASHAQAEKTCAVGIVMPLFIKLAKSVD